MATADLPPAWPSLNERRKIGADVGEDVPRQPAGAPFPVHPEVPEDVHHPQPCPKRGDSSSNRSRRLPTPRQWSQTSSVSVSPTTPATQSQDRSRSRMCAGPRGVIVAWNSAIPEAMTPMQRPIGSRCARRNPRVMPTAASTFATRSRSASILASDSSGWRSRPNSRADDAPLTTPTNRSRWTALRAAGGAGSSSIVSAIRHSR